MKKILILFLLIIFSISFFSLSYNINPKNPYAGQLININIELYKYGIFDVNVSKSFVKANDPYINIISYKIYKKNNKFFLRINFQVFKIGKISLKDILFFDGYSYYNFETISFTTNNKIKEYYILPELSKLKKIVSLQIFVAYLFFIFIFSFLFISYGKFKIFLNKYIAKKKELRYIRRNLKILFNLSKILIENNIEEIEFKKSLINFTKIINEILSRIVSCDDKDEIKNEIMVKNDFLIQNSYKSEKELIEIKKIVLDEKINDLVKLINSLIFIKYGKFKI